MELFDDLPDSSCICRRDEGNSQRRNGDEHSKEPFLSRAKVHGIAWVIVDPGDDVWIVVGPSAVIVVFDDFLCDDALVKDHFEVANGFWATRFGIASALLHGSAGCDDPGIRLVEVTPRSLYRAIRVVSFT